MRAKHGTDASAAGKVSYHGPNHGRWSTPAAPMFDATSAPRKNRYRPEPSAQHYADIGLGDSLKQRRKDIRKMDRIHRRITEKAASQAVKLIKDGKVTAVSYKAVHGAILAPTPHVNVRRPYSKPVEMSHEAQQAARDHRPTVGTYYPPIKWETAVTAGTVRFGPVQIGLRNDLQK